MIRLFFAWLTLAAFFCLFIFAADGGKSLWLHLHWPPHRQRMQRAKLCLEAAHHWKRDGFVARRFRQQAYRLCEECGCPADRWPAGVRKLCQHGLYNLHALPPTPNGYVGNCPGGFYLALAKAGGLDGHA